MEENIDLMKGYEKTINERENIQNASFWESYNEKDNKNFDEKIQERYNKLYGNTIFKINSTPISIQCHWQDNTCKNFDKHFIDLYGKEAYEKMFDMKEIDEKIEEKRYDQEVKRHEEFYESFGKNLDIEKIKLLSGIPCDTYFSVIENKVAHVKNALLTALNNLEYIQLELNEMKEKYTLEIE